MGAILVYFIISALAVEFFRQMRVEVEDVVSNSSRITVEKLNFHLRRWKQRYVFMSQLIDWISQCFGFILLQSIVYFYICIVNGTFYLILSFSSRNHLDIGINFVIQISKQFGYLMIISYLPSEVKKEVSVDAYFIYFSTKKRTILIFIVQVAMIYKSLRQFELNESNIQRKV